MENIYNCFEKIKMPTPEQVVPRRKSRAVSSFLKKTYEILEESDNHYAIKWAIDGIGFIVVKEEVFSKEILPKYFKHSNYSSFVRQLNMYNFHKIRESNYESHFHHEFFRRDQKSLLSQIRRKPEKKKRKDDESDDQAKSQISVKDKISKSSSSLKKETLQKHNPVSSASPAKKSFQNTRHVCISEKEQVEGSKERVSIQNILSQENEQDKISINNELVERFPRCPTKQIFYPSNNNIYPFPYRGPISHFSIFF